MSEYKPYYLKDVIDNANKELFTVISTFAGGGGSSTGYRLAGGKILCVNEFVESAVETYKENYPNTPILTEDIKQLKGEDFLKIAGIQKGELDLLDGSPPCSAFSTAGKREKGWDQTKKYSDGKTVENIEDLFFEFTRIANDLQPKVVIGENVAGITMGEAKEYFNRIVNEFSKIGYEAVGKVLNAADYETPQGRQRCFFVAVRNDVMDKVGLNFMTLESEVYPDPKTPDHISLRSAIDDVISDPDQEKELFEYVQNGFQKKWIELLEFNPTRHRKPSDPEFIDINPKRSMFNMIRPCPDLPCPTLTQRGQQMSVSGVFHYNKNRKFTVPELKRIMGLPEDYKLKGKFDQQAERIGRMVAPLMMKNLASHIYEKVIKPYKIEQK
jgi:DNA (cytosine-5)-methyltransferase 1